jgi:hypothetical protein
MSHITRRQFSCAAGSLALLGAGLPRIATAAQGQKGAGIQRVTRGLVLQTPSTTPKGETWRYGLTIPFQVASKQAAAFVNLRLEYPPGGDWEVGTDVVVFDRLGKSAPQRIFPISRVDRAPNPNSKPPGKPALILKYPVRGGFVPLGAKRRDGSPHPHAGTGFGLLHAMAAPMYTREEIRAATDNLAPFLGPERYTYEELQQYTYDGQQFRVAASERLTDAQILDGWTIPGVGLTNAIPDGDDFLLGATARKPGVDPSAGVTTWKRGPKGWRPTAFVPISGGDGSIEASLVRDVDGSLLFSARGTKQDTRNNLRMWRAERVDGEWKQVINVPGVVAGPITINQAADGTPYVVSNLFEVARFSMEPRWIIIVGAGLARSGGWMRETLCMWPLNDARNETGTPIVIRESRKEFGPPPDGSTWMADHPAGAIVQLADGGWHSVLCYRIGTRGEMTNYGSDPAPQTGAYFDEVHSSGTPVPQWQF